jgi:hypothetical protein
MPASFSLRSPDVRRLVTELKRIEPDLYNEMRREFRRELRPDADSLTANIPSASPLSGMTRRGNRALQTIDQRSPYVWKKPKAKIEIDFRSRKRKSRPIVRIIFNDKRPYSAFSILETARTSRNQRGANMIQGIEGHTPARGKGRWVIQQFYDRRERLVDIARQILQAYGVKVSARMARRVR